MTTATAVTTTAALPATDHIEVIDRSVENGFPDQLVFRLQARSQTGPFSRVALNFHLLGNESITIQPMDIEPQASEIDVSHTLRTRYSSLPPGAPFEFWWQLRDEAGNELTTAPEIFHYEDLRQDWQRIENDELLVQWYDGDAAFGQSLFDISADAIQRLEQETGQPLEIQTRVVIFGSHEDLHEAFPYSRDWVAGQAFPGLGITVQTVPPTVEGLDWAKSVLAHEVAHLYNYQVMSSPLSARPQWLDEGLATQAEPESQDFYHYVVEQAARNDQLLPLAFITGNFGHDSDEATLAYAQSLSMVEFMTSQFGRDAMSRLVSGLKSGLWVDQAFQQAVGVDQAAFYEYWKAMTVARARLRVTPTPPPGALGAARQLSERKDTTL